MPRMRTIHPEICIDKKLAEMDNADAERTWMRLWTHCDDEGRAIDDSRLIKAALYPRLDSMTPERVESDIVVLAEYGFVVRYDDGDESYLHVPSFADWQKPNRRFESKHPAPPSCTPQPPSSDIAVTDTEDALLVVGVGDGDVKGVGVVGDVDGRSAPSKRRGTQLPADFAIPDSMRLWASEKGIRSDLERETEKFKNHFAAKGETKKDWVAAWRNWMLNADDWRKSARGDPKKAGAEALVEHLRRTS